WPGVAATSGKRTYFDPSTRSVAERPEAAASGSRIATMRICAGPRYDQTRGILDTRVARATTACEKPATLPCTGGRHGHTQRRSRLDDGRRGLRLARAESDPRRWPDRRRVRYHLRLHGVVGSRGHAHSPRSPR